MILASFFQNIRVLIVLLLSGLTAACAGSLASGEAGSDKPGIAAPAASGDEAISDLERARQQSLDDLDRDACRAARGRIEQAGILGMYRCTIDYEDAGALCRDASDCAGRCLTSADVTDFDAAPGEGQGRCEADDNPFGCYGVMNDGVVGAMICVD